ncbi:MAG: hypothetical protein F6K19_01795 [Cyanothece sp. SIO1E1]|nr:hypothetical protein [Cyanothece sp. SIO1E1]
MSDIEKDFDELIQKIEQLSEKHNVSVLFVLGHPEERILEGVKNGVENIYAPVRIEGIPMDIVNTMLACAECDASFDKMLEGIGVMRELSKNAQSGVQNDTSMEVAAGNIFNGKVGSD